MPVVWTFTGKLIFSFPNVLPHVLIRQGMATLITSGQVLVRARSTKQKHPTAAATLPAYRA
jgi:hypothetical protein